MRQVGRALDQIDHPAVPASEAANAEVGNPARLPYPLTDLLGRETEIEALSELLAKQRLVTVTGPGGTGKTRLAIEVARAMLPHFHGGAVFVDLTAISDPSLVCSELIEALGFQKTPGTPLVETLLSGLKTKRILLVLDNFEQIVDGARRGRIGAI